MGTVNASDIIPSREEMEAMGRRRYQEPEIFKTKSKRPEWYFRARIDVLMAPGVLERREKTYYLGFCDEMKKNAAKVARDKVLEEVINRPQLVINSQVKFSKMVEAYKRDYLPNLRPITRPVYESLIKYCEKEFGETQMCKIKPQPVQAWANKLPPRQKRKIVGVFGRIWQKAREWEYTQDGNPAEFVNYGQRPMPRPKAIPTQEQYLKLRALLAPPLDSMADVAVTMGLRISEIRGLPVRCIDVAAGAVRIEQRLDELDNMDDPKSFKGWRVLPMGSLKQMFVKAIVGKRPNDLVFETPMYQTVQNYLKAAAVAVGCDAPGFGWHSLRRCHNTWLRKGGASTQDAMDQMGHASAAVNDIYVIAESEDFKRRERLVSDLQERLIGKAVGPTQ